MRVVHCRIPSKPFQLTTQFSERCGGDGCRCLGVSTYSRRVLLRRMMMMDPKVLARPAAVMSFAAAP